MGMPGIFELVIIFGVALLLFGSKKLPALGGSVGDAIKNFKKSMKGDDGGDETKNLQSPENKPEVIDVEKK